jgi:hypothetical protein
VFADETEEEEVANDGYEEFQGNRFWADDWIRSLMMEGKFPHILLFEWCWTGPLRSPSGLFHCPLEAVRNMACFTRLTPGKFRSLVEEATEQPSAGLAWFPEYEYWWVKNYVLHRRDHANKLIASAKDLMRHPVPLASLAIAYYQTRGVDLMTLDHLKEFAHVTPDFPYPTDTLREGYAIDIETYAKPSSSPKPYPNPNKNPTTVTTGVAKAPPGWNECRQAYHEGYLSLTGEKPIMDVVDTSRLKTVLKTNYAGEGEWEKLVAVINYAVSGKDEAWNGSLPSFQTILSKYHLNRITSKLAKRQGA